MLLQRRVPSSYYPGMTPVSGSDRPCWKPNYTPPSIPSVCYPNLVFGTDNLCYPECLPGYDGSNFCWPTTCPSSFGPYICNQTLCTPNSACSIAEATQTTQVLTQINATIASVSQFNMENLLRTMGTSTITVTQKMAGSS